MSSSQKCVSDYIIIIEANKHSKMAQDNPIATALIDIFIACGLLFNVGIVMVYLLKMIGSGDKGSFVILIGLLAIYFHYSSSIQNSLTKLQVDGDIRSVFE